MGITPSKEEDEGPVERTKKGADATASLSEDENPLAAPETLGRKKEKGSRVDSSTKEWGQSSNERRECNFD